MTTTVNAATRSVSPSFPLGKLLATGQAETRLSRSDLLACVRRHARGEFGLLCAEEIDANLAAIASGDGILSVYVCNGSRVYVVTEADRSTTSVILAEEL